MKPLFATALAILTTSSASAIVVVPDPPTNDVSATFDQSDFTVTPVYNNVQTFGFMIDLDGPIVAGQTYTNPALTLVTYNVSGSLSGTPSGFPAFALSRTITGADFYSQGSSLSFSVAPIADLSDGLQLAELLPVAPVVGVDSPVFVFNGREVNTGRYHPALIQLFADGTGTIQNSNNTGGINPANSQLVDVTFGEEYITNLSFDPNTLTLFTAENVPEPTSLALLGLGGLLLARRRRTADRG